jgi:hypothetical protein
VRRQAVISEAAFHMQTWKYLRVALPPEVRAFHTPNGGLRNKAEAGKLKAMGVVPGLWVFVFIFPNAEVGMLELKVGKNGLTDEQEEWGDWLLQRGAAREVCWTIDEVERVVTRWLAAYGLRPRATLTIQQPLWNP